MEQHHAPGLSTRGEQHELFREKVAAFLEAHRAGKPGVPVSLMLFMQNWLKAHFLKTDENYSAFLNARGVRCSCHLVRFLRFHLNRVPHSRRLLYDSKPPSPRA